MSALESIGAIGGIEGLPLALRISGGDIGSAAPPHGPGFGDLVMRGLQALDQSVATADGLVQQFALDDSVPVHQVTIALEQARLSVELAMQVRARLLEGYRELMNMPL